MPRRGENIYKRKDGRWEGRIAKGYEGDRRVYQSLYGKSYREVKDKMECFRQELPERRKGGRTLDETAEMWMRVQSEYWKEGTCSTYRQMLNKYVIPHLGRKPVCQITNRVLLEFSTKIASQDGQPLSRNYIFQICSLVRRIMIYTKKHFDGGITVPENPIKKEQVRNIILPSESTMMILEKYLYENCEKDTCVGILIAFHTGIRVGELSALMWKDIDLEEGTLYIRKNLLRVHNRRGEEKPENSTKVVSQEPKSSDSARVIPLPPCLITVLKEHRKEESLYVISGIKASWAEPRTIQYRFKSILKKCEIEYFNFHILRHAFATRCVAMGLDVKTLSEILGHSSIQLTLNLYVHSTIQQKRLMMQQYDSVIH